MIDESHEAQAWASLRRATCRKCGSINTWRTPAGRLICRPCYRGELAQRDWFRDDRNIIGDYTIGFTPEQLEYCRRLAIERYRSNRAGGVEDQRRHRKSRGADLDEIGLPCEYALHLLSGHSWFGSALAAGDRRKGLPDVGPMEVKGINAPYKRLQVMRKDLPKAMRPFVLMQHYPEGVCRLIGWRFGFEIMQDRWWTTHAPKSGHRLDEACWHVPKNRLFGVRSLIAYCESIGEPWPTRPLGLT